VAEIFEVLGSLSESSEIGSSASESSELGSSFSELSGSSSVSSSNGGQPNRGRRRGNRASGPGHNFNYTGQFTAEDLREIPIPK
jgi:hypothetical protein